MKTTKASAEAPSPEPEGTSNRSQSAVFITMALDMSWRLAVVVLLPIIGGFKLDQALGTEPGLTVAGFLVAMAGMALVMRRTLQLANRMTGPTKKAGQA